MVRRIGFSIVVGSALLVALDQVVGLLLPKPPPRSLLLPSGSSIDHESCEFRVSVNISDAGIRDRDYPVQTPEGTYRIVAVGDSFTFGWGVENEQAWPKVLQRQLNAGNKRRSPPTIEVMNFGSPGTSPANFDDTAAIVFKHDRPDLMIVATLQGDDLIQLYSHRDAPRPVWPRVANALFPTTSRLLRPEVKRDPMVSYRQTFFLTQQHVRSQFTADQKDRYDSLSPRVRTFFEAGLLNPSLVQTSVTNSNYFLEPLKGSREWCDVVVKRLTQAFSSTKNDVTNMTVA